jgi:hypothetical protein
MWYLYAMGFYSATRKNEILKLAGKWIELQNIILSKVSQALSYVDHRPRTNAVMLLDMGHTLRGDCMW